MLNYSGDAATKPVCKCNKEKSCRSRKTDERVVSLFCICFELLKTKQTIITMMNLFCYNRRRKEEEVINWIGGAEVEEGGRIEG